MRRNKLLKFLGDIYFFFGAISGVCELGCVTLAEKFPNFEAPFMMISEFLFPPSKKLPAL